ncbi:hypothetical protein KC332_g59 [Hortaea werneckii]|nr:hypothetical protein KC332_g59 [Hortaea werneckii]
MSKAAITRDPRLSKIEGHGSRRLSTMKEREHIHPWRKCHSKHRFHCWLLAAEAAVAPIARIFASVSWRRQMIVFFGFVVYCRGYPKTVKGRRLKAPWMYALTVWRASNKQADVEAEVVAAGTRASWGREFRNRPPAKRPKRLPLTCIGYHK